MILAEPLSVIGLGKLGLGFAACLAKGGFDVLGVDLDPGVVDSINDKSSAFDEPGIASAIATTTGGTLRAVTEISAGSHTRRYCVRVVANAEPTRWQLQIRARSLKLSQIFADRFAHKTSSDF